MARRVFGTFFAARAQRRRTSPDVPSTTGAAALIAALPEPTLLLQGWRVTQVNQAAVRELGGATVGQDIRLLLRHPAALDLLRTQTGGSVEFDNEATPGQRFELRVAPVEEGVRLLQLIDRSAVQQADRSRTDFVANASHELRTPLAAIRGFIETLEDDAAGADAALRRRFLQVMRGEARRMENLIDDLLSLSRIEADKFVLPDRRVALAELLEEVLTETLGPDGELPANLVARSVGAPVVVGDRSQLSQLLHNLLDNARRYGGDGTISVTIEEDAEHARMTVADEGPGVAKEQLARLTQRFYRAEHARSGEGTGLGLAIVKHIVERHRGLLEIASEPGQGLQVTILLPLAATVTQPSSI